MLLGQMGLHGHSGSETHLQVRQAALALSSDAHGIIGKGQQSLHLNAIA